MLNKFLRWDGYIFPQLAKIIYFVGLGLIGLGTVVGALGALFGGIMAQQGAGGIVGFIVALIVGAISALIWRISVELWTVLFGIHDLLKQIRDRKAL